jgi:hypothetical protein
MVQVNLGPLSDCSYVGISKRGLNSLKSRVATVEAFLLVVGKTLIHTLKVSMRTRRLEDV